MFVDEVAVDKQHPGKAEFLAWRKAHRFSPNQLRHNFASTMRRDYGIDTAQVLLGHSRVDMTQVYAETNREQGVMLAAKIG